MTRHVEFCAAHRYFRKEWDEETNHTHFGKCSNLNGHGHNYMVSLSVTGPIDPITGMIVNISCLKKILHEKVFLPLDHSRLDLDIPYFNTRIPTCETLAQYIWQSLKSSDLPKHINMVKLKIHESRSLYAEIINQEYSQMK